MGCVRFVWYCMVLHAIFLQLKWRKMLFVVWQRWLFTAELLFIRFGAGFLLFSLFVPVSAKYVTAWVIEEIAVGKPHTLLWRHAWTRNLKFWFINLRSSTDCSSVYVLYFNHEQPLSRDSSLLTSFIDNTADIILSKVPTIISVRELLSKHFVECALSHTLCTSLTSAFLSRFIRNSFSRFLSFFFVFLAFSSFLFVEKQDN